MKVYRDVLCLSVDPECRPLGRHTSFSNSCFGLRRSDKRKASAVTAFLKTAGCRGPTQYYD